MYPGKTTVNCIFNHVKRSALEFGFAPKSDPYRQTSKMLNE